MSVKKRTIDKQGPQTVKLWCARCRKYTIIKTIRKVTYRRFRGVCPKCGSLVKLKAERTGK